MAKFGQNHCTIVQGLLSDFGATLKNHKKSKLDWNQFKLSRQHVYASETVYIINSTCICTCVGMFDFQAVPPGLSSVQHKGRTIPYDPMVSMTGMNNN